MLPQIGQAIDTYWRTPAPFRRHIGPGIAEWALARRQVKAWAPHLAQSRGLIDTLIDDLPRRRTVLVLGSGLLLDLPVESLGRCFERVVLIDRVHVAAAQRRTARYGAVVHLWRDLGFEDVAGWQALFAGFADLDWVISSTLVAHLGAGLDRAVGRRRVEAHLAALATLPVPATLITETDFRLVNRHGVLLDQGDMLCGHEMPRPGLRWKWERAPFGEEQRHARRVYQVAAWPDWRQAR